MGQQQRQGEGLCAALQICRALPPLPTTPSALPRTQHEARSDELADVREFLVKLLGPSGGGGGKL